MTESSYYEESNFEISELALGRAHYLHCLVNVLAFTIFYFIYTKLPNHYINNIFFNSIS